MAVFAEAAASTPACLRCKAAVPGASMNTLPEKARVPVARVDVPVLFSGTPVGSPDKSGRALGRHKPWGGRLRRGFGAIEAFSRGIL